MPSRAVEIQACRARLAPGPVAAAEVGSQVRAAIAAWNAPADADVAALLTSELVTNAAKHATGQAITLGIRCTRDRLRVDVHDWSPGPPVLTETPAGAEAGRRLVLVASVSAAWGSYRIPAGKVVYFALVFRAGSGRPLALSMNPADTGIPGSMPIRCAARSAGTFPCAVSSTAAVLTTGPYEMVPGCARLAWPPARSTGRSAPAAAIR